MLEVRGLSTGYGPTEVLFDCSLDVLDGALVVVIGPNGHGKSTLLRAISGLLPARTGTVSMAGADITAVPAQGASGTGSCNIPGRSAVPRHDGR
jgi:ABC-type branched-subunit amino acid transport system ATPase component